MSGKPALRLNTHELLSELNQVPKPTAIPSMGLELDVPILDPEVQVRVALDQETVHAYAQEMLNGRRFPPIIVFNVGGNFYVADGFHRVKARRAAYDRLSTALRNDEVEGAAWERRLDELAAIDADVRQGTKRDAIFYAIGANDDHGLRRTRQDVERAVLSLLNDPEWGKMSQRQIADAAGTTPPTVGNIMRRHGMTTGEAGVVIGADGRTQRASQGRPRNPQVVARRIITSWATGKKAEAVDKLSPEERAATAQALDDAIARLQEQRKRFR